MNLLERFFDYYNEHKGGINGAVVGFVIAVAVLVLGLFKVIFISICMGVGYYIGKRLYEDKDYIKNLLDRVLPPGTYR